MKPYKFLLSGGGTGGHIYPALAIANELKLRYPDAQFLFVGASDRMEMEKIPAAGYKIKGLWIAGIQRKLTFKNLLFPLKLLVSIVKSFIIIYRFKPNVVIGTGGFASGPILFAASMLKIPTLIQEQNSFPGITNKLLAKKVNSICVAYKNLERFFPKEKLIVTGNPVRQDLLSIHKKREKAFEHFKLNSKKQVVLVLGGSLGAKKINELIENHLPFFDKNNLQVLWQCGKLYYDRFKKYEDFPNLKIHQFINQMDLAYAAADVIISRAGASSVSELCIVGKPVIFIPSPNVAEDHQTKNARAIEEKHAAIVLPETDLETFEVLLESLLKDKGKLESLSENIKELALPSATQHIANQIDKLIKK